MDPAQAQQSLAQAQQHIQQQAQAIQALQQQLQALTAQVQNAPQQQQQPAAPPAPPAPKLPKPSTFTGERAASTLQPWLVQLKTYLAATPNANLNSTNAVDVAAAFLGGSALIWYDSLKTAAQRQTPFATWDLFAKAVTAYYLPYDRYDDAFTKIKNLRQIGAALGYVNKFNELMLSCSTMDAHTQRLMFMSGLKPSVKEAVEMQQPADLAAAQELAIRADNIQFQNRPRPSQSTQPNYRASNQSGPTPMELGAHSAEPAPGELYAFKCYNCNEEGHMAKDCPKPRRERPGGRGRGGRHYKGGRNRGWQGRGRNNTHHGAPN